MNGATVLSTLDLIKQAQAAPSEDLKKFLLEKASTYTQATGLVPFDLQAPAKNLYPVSTPLRNRIARVGGGVGTATNWKVISAITGSGYDAMGWVPEGQRSGSMSVTEADKAATYRTLGEEASATYEAQSAGRTFEDIRASMVMRLLQKTMLKEEMAILGGNQSLALGTPGTPTLSASGTGATLPAATYSVIVVALTQPGYLMASLANGVPTSQTLTGNDGQTYTMNGGSSNQSAAATQAVTLGQTLFASVAAVSGALAYAWYVGTAGSEKLEAITTINSAKFTAPLAGTHQAATAITADHSKNSTLAFDGLLTWAFGGGGYVNTLATGTAGTGTTLTASGRGSINEIDTMLKSMWDLYQVSPSVIYVNSQQQLDITNKVLSNASGPLLRYNTDGKDPYAIVANGVVEYYYNPFSLQGGNKVQVALHPNMPSGTILAWSDELPPQYQSNNVPKPVEMKTRREYYQIDWPIVTRANTSGVYVEEVLAVYAPFAMGLITNIAAG